VYSPAKATIDLGALRANYRLASALAPDSETLAIVKARAYGHGAAACAAALEDLAPAFGVCFIEEALELRAAGIRKPVLLLRGNLDPDEVQLAAEQDFWLMVYEPHQVDSIVARSLSNPVTVWVKLDTGMHRLGLQPGQLADAVGRLQLSENVRQPLVVATHFACADDVGNPFTGTQLERLHAAVTGMDVLLSAANSAGVIAWPGARADWNRPGIMLYGASPMCAAHTVNAELVPVMRLESRVIALRHIGAGETVGYGGNWTAQRPSTIATVAIGYGDGYPRHAANGTPVLVNGRRAPLVGRVSMDMITVDVTDLPVTAIGDRVTLWGPDLPVNEVAACAGTIGYELLTRMTGRVPLDYGGHGAA
jgi:alanine racemase